MSNLCRTGAIHWQQTLWRLQPLVDPCFRCILAYPCWLFFNVYAEKDERVSRWFLGGVQLHLQRTTITWKWRKRARFSVFLLSSMHSYLHGFLFILWIPTNAHVNISVMFNRRMGSSWHSYIPMILLLTEIISIYTLRYLLGERGIYVFVRNAKMLVFNDNNTICSLFSPKFPSLAGFRTENRMSCVVFIVTCYNCVFQQVNPVRHFFSRQLTCYYFLQICPRWKWYLTT